MRGARRTDVRAAGANGRPRVGTAYRRAAIVVVLVLVGRWALADDGSGGREGERAGATPSTEGSEVVRLDVPTPFVVREFDPASQPGGIAIFDDVSGPAGVEVAHHADRVPKLEVPASRLAAAMGDDDPSDAAIEQWAGETLSPFITDMASLSYYITGQAWGDIDGDGDPDLYLTDQVGPNVLLHNDGAGTFSPSALGDDVALADHKSGGAVFVDYDNDGWSDLHVLGDGPDVLFRNDEGRGFVDVSGEAGVDDPGMGETATWGDYDSDGFLDLYVVNYGCQPCNDAPPVPAADRDQDRLFHNDGDGTFTDVTTLIDDIDGTRGLGFSASWFDHDGDGDLDLYVVNDVRNDRADEEVAAGIERGDGSTPGNVLLRNDGEGCGGWCFHDATEQSGAASRSNAMGLTVSDVDGDGAMDLFFTNSGYDAGPTRLLLNDGRGTFRDAAAETGANLGEWSWGCSFLDVDNDGRLDVYVAVGHSELALHTSLRSLPGEPAASDAVETRAAIRDGTLPEAGPVSEPPWPVVASSAPRTDNDRVLRQQADGTFDEVVLGPTDAYSGITFGTATADFDGDGWIDVVVGNIDSGYRLLRNQAEVGAGNRRLVVDLEGDGRRVNRDAVGSVVTVETSDGRRQSRLVAAGGSLGSGSDLAVVVGLGPAEVASVTVRWPDGTTSAFEEVAADTRVALTYGSDEVGSTPLAAPG